MAGFSKFAPDSHSLVKPVRVPVTNILDCLEVSTAFRFWVNCRHKTDRETHNQSISSTSSTQYKCTVVPRRSSKNAPCMLLDLQYMQAACNACYIHNIWML